eukprot:363865-Chlamydomonas_euryale.AAC.28
MNGTVAFHAHRATASTMSALRTNDASRAACTKCSNAAYRSVSCVSVDCPEPRTSVSTACPCTCSATASQNQVLAGTSGASDIFWMGRKSPFGTTCRRCSECEAAALSGANGWNTCTLDGYQVQVQGSGNRKRDTARNRKDHVTASGTQHITATTTLPQAGHTFVGITQPNAQPYATSPSPSLPPSLPIPSQGMQQRQAACVASHACSLHTCSRAHAACTCAAARADSSASAHSPMPAAARASLAHSSTLTTSIVESVSIADRTSARAVSAGRLTSVRDTPSMSPTTRDVRSLAAAAPDGTATGAPRSCCKRA